MAILNINSPGITYKVVDDSPIVIKVINTGTSSETNGDYYTFKDENDVAINIGNGTFRFMRGRSYQFQANDISGSHPFIIHISGSNTSSISGTSGNIDITIPVDHSTTSGDLYYECSTHVHRCEKIYSYIINLFLALLVMVHMIFFMVI